VRRIRHYVNDEGVYLHAQDLENTFRRLQHETQEECGRRMLGACADALHGHSRLVLEDTVARVFSPSIFQRLGL